jgi:elongation factor 1-beta|tara:strand:- start:76 stop:342 length:267 start_codon:yes stop_codon:yes gene_type:complete
MTAIVKIKLMPSSPETNLEEIKEKVKKLIKNGDGKGVKFEEEPIAFGLKAVIVFFLWDEGKELEPLENSLEKIENVNSVEMMDMRRAI